LQGFFSCSHMQKRNSQYRAGRGAASGFRGKAGPPPNLKLPSRDNASRPGGGSAAGPEPGRGGQCVKNLFAPPPSLHLSDGGSCVVVKKRKSARRKELLSDVSVMLEGGLGPFEGPARRCCHTPWLRGPSARYKAVSDGGGRASAWITGGPNACGKKTALCDPSTKDCRKRICFAGEKQIRGDRMAPGCGL